MTVMDGEIPFSVAHTKPPVFLICHLLHKEGYSYADSERATIKGIKSGVETCKCIRQRMIHSLCIETLAMSFRFGSKSILG